MPTLSALAENLIRVRSPGKDLAASILHKFRAAAGISPLFIPLSLVRALCSSQYRLLLLSD